MTKKPTLRSRQAERNPSVQPAESARTMTGHSTEWRIVAYVVASGDLGGQLGDAGIEHGDVGGDGVHTGVNGAKEPRDGLTGLISRSRTWDGSRSRPCTWQPPALCSPSGCRSARRRCPRRPGRSPTSPTSVAKPRHAPRPLRRSVPNGWRRRSRGSSGRPWCQKAPSRTDRRRFAGARCRGSSRHRTQDQGHLQEDLATVVERHTRARPRHARRQRVAQPQSVGEAAESV